MRRQFYFVGALASVLALPALAGNDAGGVASPPTVKVVRPQDVPPTTRPNSDFRAGGPAVHRRAISKAKDGSVDLDVGYNVYEPGVGSAEPYAYTKDEFCYLSTGEVEFDSDGVLVVARSGNLMWRPAGAATQRTLVRKKSIGVCGFSPARDEGHGHRIPPADVGRWSGDPTKKPRVRWYAVTEVPEVRATENPDYAVDGVTERRLLAVDRDGSPIDVTQYAVQAGVTLARTPPSGERICWLESGQASLGVRHQKVLAHDFIYQPAGAAMEPLSFYKASVLLCFASPGRGLSG